MPIRGGFVAKATGKQSEFQENTLIAELIARGAENSRMLRGFVGPSRDDRYITLYQSLARLGDTVEIPREDILHSVDAPGSSLGAVILWVKDDSQISVRRSQTETEVTSGPGSRVQEVTKGRLRMQLRAPWGGGVCTSVCEPCISWCDCNICQTLPE
jgi:hypothetical protein